MDDVKEALVEVSQQLQQKRIEDLYLHLESAPEKVKIVANIFTAMISAAIFYRPNLANMLIIKSLELILKHGICEGLVININCNAPSVCIS